MLIELLTQIILKINAMRTQLELWKVVKENFDEYFSFGLCQLIDSLRLNPKESQRTLVVG